MLNIAIMALRYIFLVFLLVFIFRLVKWMVGDLQQTRRHYSGLRQKTGQPAGVGNAASGGALLAVKDSASPDFRPGDFLPLGRQNLLGRGEASDILIRDSFASSRHARVFFNEEQYWLEDLQSTNGTFLNEVKIDQPTLLADGDIIKIGGIIFQFVRWGHEVGSAN
ncbi:FHA domain-containing protein FhaB [Pelotomaculum schinkii]|uniref:FHA domain-containing protein FhaB n=1 Tax=Pelotomaculum schinkii TaxID=78350 RepID=A0A4Y7RAC9_9FIRM|nr:FHA domain-containing protein [Pelotomaculum schinkii]TEB05736.1 FHA domain-containing protein FhaB [Pelotomaculum schinkii]